VPSKPRKSNVTIKPAAKACAAAYSFFDAESAIPDPSFSTPITKYL
jgi:hypothetical protein